MAVSRGLVENVRLHCTSYAASPSSSSSWCVPALLSYSGLKKKSSVGFLCAQSSQVRVLAASRVGSVGRGSRQLKGEAAATNGSPQAFDYDVVIIGAGVGGHGAALHAVEKAVTLRGSACRAIKGNVEIVHNLTGISRINSVGVAPRDAASSGRGSQIVVHGRSGRSAMYGDAETYVLMEPGEDEQFVTAEELQDILKNWLQEWPGKKPPIDLTKFKSVDEAVQFLVNAVCELDLGDGQGSLQWYEVRMEQE